MYAERDSLFVVLDGELQVTRHDTRLLVIARGVPSEFEDLSGQVLEDSGEVDGGTSTDALGVVALLQETVDTADGELDYRRATRRDTKLAPAPNERERKVRCELTSSLGRARLRLGVGLSTGLARLATDFARFSLA